MFRHKPNMAKPLTTEQIKALQSVPLVEGMPNRLRVALGMVDGKQSEIVVETGLLASMVSDIVNGKYGDLNVGTARKFADFFGCGIDDLFPRRAA